MSVDFGQINSRHLRRAFVTNQTSSAFTAKVITITKPSNDGVVPLVYEGEEGAIAEKVRVFPFGAGSDNDAFDLKVWGWSRIKNGGGTGIDLWFPSVLLTITCTISSFVGVSGAGSLGVLNTDRFADTIAIKAAIGEARITADTTNGGTTEFYSPADNTPGYAQFQTRGAELLEFDSDETTNTPTANALIQLF